MAKQAVNLDFLKVSQIQNALAHPLPSAPSSPVESQFYYDTTLKAFGVYNGTTWIYFSASTIQSIAAEDGTIVIDATDPANPTIKVSIPDLIDDSQSTSSNIYSAAKVDSQIAAAVTGLWDDRGNYDASSDEYPSVGGSGTAGAILKGDIFTISVAGNLGGEDVEIGDTVRALIDNPGQTSANWAIGQNNIGYVPENSANKTDDIASNVASSVLYPSTKGVADYVQAQSLKTFQGSYLIADFVGGVLTIPASEHGLGTTATLQVFVYENGIQQTGIDINNGMENSNEVTITVNEGAEFDLIVKIIAL